MRNASKLLLPLIAAAALAACNKPSEQANVAANESAGPVDVEALPPDESSETSSNELVNGADNADVNDTSNIANNSY